MVTVFCADTHSGNIRNKNNSPKALQDLLMRLMLLFLMLILIGKVAFASKYNLTVAKLIKFNIDCINNRLINISICFRIAKIGLFLAFWSKFF